MLAGQTKQIQTFPQVDNLFFKMRQTAIHAFLVAATYAGYCPGTEVCIQ